MPPFTKLSTSSPNMLNHNNLGDALRLQSWLTMEKVDKALTNYHFAGLLKGLAIRPDSAEAHSDLGIALQKVEKLDLAVACFLLVIDIILDFSIKILGKSWVNKQIRDRAYTFYNSFLN